MDAIERLQADRRERQRQAIVAQADAERSQRAAENARNYEANTTECPECCGKGFNDEWRAVSGRFDGGEVFRIDCDACEQTGRISEAQQ